VAPATLADEAEPRRAAVESERKEIIAAVEKSRGNIASAARTLGIQPLDLYTTGCAKHGLEHCCRPRSRSARRAGAASARWRAADRPARRSELARCVGDPDWLAMLGDHELARTPAGGCDTVGA